MRKNIKSKIIAINLTLLGILIIAIEGFSHHTFYQKYKSIMDTHNIALPEKSKLKIKYTSAHLFTYSEYKKLFKSVESKKNTKRPIILFGCSYTEGVGINDEKATLTYQLARLTHRNIYNRGVGGTGTQFMYYQLNDTNIKKEIPDAEYIIYTFLDYHFLRLFNYTLSSFKTDINLRYKQSNDKLIEVKPIFPWMYSLFTVKNIQESISNKNIQTEELNNYPLFKTIMEESMKKAKEKYPNAKFVILVYPSGNYVRENVWREAISEKDPCKLPKELEKHLTSLGFIVVNAEDIAGTKLRTLDYRTIDKDHPNPKAWATILPPLVKKLNL